MLVIPGQLPGLNEYTAANRGSRYSGNRMKHTSETDIMWAAKAARLAPVEGACRMVFDWFEPDRRRDLDNVAFAKKFILDALVKVRVLADDGRRFVTGFEDRFHVDEISPRVVVTIEKVEP